MGICAVHGLLLQRPKSKPLARCGGLRRKKLSCGKVKLSSLSRGRHKASFSYYDALGSTTHTMACARENTYILQFCRESRYHHLNTASSNDFKKKPPNYSTKSVKFFKTFNAGKTQSILEKFHAIPSFLNAPIVISQMEFSQKCKLRMTHLIQGDFGIFVMDEIVQMQNIM